MIVMFRKNCLRSVFFNVKISQFFTLRNIYYLTPSTTNRDMYFLCYEVFPCITRTHMESKYHILSLLELHCLKFVHKTFLCQVYRCPKHKILCMFTATIYLNEKTKKSFFMYALFLPYQFP